MIRITSIFGLWDPWETRFSLLKFSIELIIEEDQQAVRLWGRKLYEQGGGRVIAVWGKHRQWNVTRNGIYVFFILEPQVFTFSVGYQSDEFRVCQFRGTSLFSTRFFV